MPEHYNGNETMKIELRAKHECGCSLGVILNNGHGILNNNHWLSFISSRPYECIVKRGKGKRASENANVWSDELAMMGKYITTKVMK